MSAVRLLVGTKKGAFVLTSDGTRDDWNVEGPAVRGVGDVPPQRVAGRSGPAVRVPVHRLARAGRPALGRRREDVGAGRQRVRLRRRPRHAPVVRRHAASLGVRARLAPRAVADGPGHGVRRRRGRGALPSDGRRPDAGRSSRGSATTRPARSGSRARAGCACTRSSSTPTTRSGCSSRSPRRARSAPTTAARRGSRSTRACARASCRTRSARSGTASTGSR